MSCKPRLFYLSIIALTLVGLNSEVFAQDSQPAKDKPAAERQTPEAATSKEPTAKAEADESDHSEMTLNELTRDFKKGYRDYLKKYRSASAAENGKLLARIPKPKSIEQGSSS